MMRKVIQSWNLFMEQENKPVDSRQVAKVVLINAEGKVLFLKRTDYVEKYAGEWDLPGGHLHIGEPLEKGLRRETREETGLSIGPVQKVKELGNIIFFKAKYVDGDIKLSKEHSSFSFRDVKDLKNPSKFEKVAKEALQSE